MIAVDYKCRCMDVAASIECPPRQDSEDILVWMNVVQWAIYLDHRKRSPDCKATEVEYAKIPAPENAPFLGGTPKVN